MDTSSEIEAQRYLGRLTRNIIIGFATPPALALILSCLPHTEIPVLEAAKGLALYVTAGEAGWIGVGVIIEGGKALKRVLTPNVSSTITG